MSNHTQQEYESQLQMLAESNSDQLQSLQEIIDTEKQRRDDLESEFNKLKLVSATGGIIVYLHLLIDVHV